MKLFTMTGPKCLLYSAAMVLGCEPNRLKQLLGHEGLEILWPERVGLKRYRGIHMQELIPIFLQVGKALVLIEGMPQLGTAPYVIDVIPEVKAMDRFRNYIKGVPGILINGGPNPHACAWDGKQVFDPRGYIYPLEDLMFIESMWLSYQIKRRC